MDRRRRTLLTVVGLTLSACALPFTAPRSPVPVGPLGAVIKSPDHAGSEIECRGIARDRCLSAGAIESEIGGIPIADVERIIVSCEGAPCTAAGGAMRLDVLLRDGTTREVARGGYGEFTQP